MRSGPARSPISAGSPFPVGGACDTGAYEFGSAPAFDTPGCQPPPPPPTGPSTAPTTPGRSSGAFAAEAPRTAQPPERSSHGPGLYAPRARAHCFRERINSCRLLPTSTKTTLE